MIPIKKENRGEKKKEVKRIRHKDNTNKGDSIYG